MKTSIKNTDLEIIRQHEVATLFGVTQKTIIEWGNNPDIDFPKRLKIGPNTVGYFKKDILEFLQKSQESYGDQRGAKLPKSVSSSSIETERKENKKQG